MDAIKWPLVVVGIASVWLLGVRPVVVPGQRE